MNFDYSHTPQLQTIFTTDEGSRKATGEYRVRPEVRYWLNRETYVKPFIGGGVDYFYQKFAGEGYSGAPSSGLNPYITFGASVGEKHEASFARLFEDSTRLNPSRLSGYRVNYSYTQPLYKSFALRAGIEADYLRFRKPTAWVMWTVTMKKTP